MRSFKTKKGLASKAGKASAKSKKKKKDLKEHLQTALDECYTTIEINGKKKKVTYAEAITVAMTKQAEAGNIQAANLIWDKILGKTPDKVQISDLRKDILDEIKKDK
jgi:hypothetical protein